MQENVPDAEHYTFGFKLFLMQTRTACVAQEPWIPDSAYDTGNKTKSDSISELGVVEL